MSGSRGLLSQLLAVVESLLGPELVAHRDVVLALCIEAVAFSHYEECDNVGQRARSAALLLLDLGCPDVPLALREQLAGICEHAAIGVD